MTSDSTTRFTNRVADYVRYRPGYPDRLIETLRAVTGLSAAWTVADIGAGTGISSDLFLRSGCTVFAVEPNAAMRAAAEARWPDDRRFHSVPGTAEATTLPSASIHLVAAAQAFHWFNLDAVRLELLRVLRPWGWVAIFWNSRRMDRDGLARDYEALVRAFGTDYAEVRHENVTAESLRRFFGGPFQTHTFPNEQVFDLEGLRGRLLSSSYAPTPDDPRYPRMLDAIAKMFDAHQHDGRVRLAYDTELHLGQPVV